MDVHHVSTLRPVQPFFIFSGRYRIGLISFFAIFRTRQNPFMGVSAIFPDASESFLSAFPLFIRTRQNPLYQSFPALSRRFRILCATESASMPVRRQSSSGVPCSTKESGIEIFRSGAEIPASAYQEATCSPKPPLRICSGPRRRGGVPCPWARQSGRWRWNM